MLTTVSLIEHNDIKNKRIQVYLNIPSGFFNVAFFYFLLGVQFYKLRQMEGHQQFRYASPGLTTTKKPFFVNVIIIKINE